ncbi:hypothetical protein [Aureliella helgolandensis]|uniref:Uncharacterized protein n=1 Tax=Aureliella helgolandensis TaxID=2527968 RepID=A0A518G0F9_9BACT|nr:hypothetical protein [Aureliella helgolandensis]QDV22081.1 hypothetical protein Q31a_03600 [Aureliella helgolandensis]
MHLRYILSMSLIALLSSRCSADGQIDDLLDRHESCVQSIARLDAMINVTETINEGKSVKDDLWEVRWSKELNRQRQRYRVMQLPTRDEEGNAINIGDLYEDHEFLYVLQNWDTAQSKRLADPGQQGMVRARKERRSAKLPPVSFNVAAYFALFELEAGPEDERRSLRELVTASPKCSYKGEEDVNGVKLQKLDIIHPHTRNNKYYRNCRYEVFLDASVGYLIRKLRLHVPKDTKLNRPLGEYEYNIVEFRELENACYFPMESEFTVRFPDSSSEISSKVSMKASKLTLNKSLPSTALNFVFPENAIVNFDRIDGENRRAFLWGPDNQPIREILSIADVPRPDLDAHTGSDRTWITLTIAGCGVLLVIGIVCYRKFNR